MVLRKSRVEKVVVAWCLELEGERSEAAELDGSLRLACEVGEAMHSGQFIKD